MLIEAGCLRKSWQQLNKEWPIILFASIIEQIDQKILNLCPIFKVFI